MVIDSGEHQRSKGTEEVLIRSVLYSSVLQIQTSVTLGSCCTVNTRTILKTVAGLFCVLWRYFVSGFVRYTFSVWRFLDNEERQCGQLLAVCGLSCQTDTSHLRRNGLRWEEKFFTATGPHSLSAHTRRFYPELT